MKKSLVVANGSILFIVKNLMYFNSTKFLQKLYPGFWLINLELLFDYSSLASLEVRLLRTKYKKVSDQATLIVYKFGLVLNFFMFNLFTFETLFRFLANKSGTTFRLFFSRFFEVRLLRTNHIISNNSTRVGECYWVVQWVLLTAALYKKFF